MAKTRVPSLLSVPIVEFSNRMFGRLAWVNWSSHWLAELKWAVVLRRRSMLPSIGVSHWSFLSVRL